MSLLTRREVVRALVVSVYFGRAIVLFDVLVPAAILQQPSPPFRFDSAQCETRCVINNIFHCGDGPSESACPVA